MIRNDPMPPCPPWCNPDLHGVYSDYLVHHSDPQFWKADDAPQFEFSLTRNDELAASWPDCIGQTQLSMDASIHRFSGKADGFASPNSVRDLARLLTELATLADPLYRDGAPLEQAQSLPVQAFSICGGIR